jgi:uncharacterized protein (DUF58 family)
VSRAPGVFALGVVLCLLAAAFAATSLYVAGVGLALLALASEFLTRMAARGARLERDPLRASMQEGDTLELAVAVRLGALGGGGTLLVWPGAEPLALRWRRRRSQLVALRMERRGLHTIAPSTLTIGDPFGLARRERRSPATEVLVLPRVQDVSPRALAQIAGAGRQARARRHELSGSEADALGPYRPGAPASRIHWPAVARTGELIERRLAQESDSVALIVLDAARPASTAALDACVRAAASLAVALAQAGGCSLLLPGESRAHRLDAELGSWPALHARLALIGPGGALSRTVIERATLVLWVSAATAPDLRPARGWASASYLVSPSAPAGAGTLFQVAGCAVRAIGPHGARRAA